MQLLCNKLDLSARQTTKKVYENFKYEDYDGKSVTLQNLKVPCSKELIVNCLIDEHEGFCCRAVDYSLSSLPTNITTYCVSVFLCWSGGK